MTPDLVWTCIAVCMANLCMWEENESVFLFLASA